MDRHLVWVSPMAFVSMEVNATWRQVFVIVSTRMFLVGTGVRWFCRVPTKFTNVGETVFVGRTLECVAVTLPTMANCASIDTNATKTEVFVEMEALAT